VEPTKAPRILAIAECNQWIAAVLARAGQPPARIEAALGWAPGAIARRLDPALALPFSPGDIVELARHLRTKVPDDVVEALESIEGARVHHPRRGVRRPAQRALDAAGSAASEIALLFDGVTKTSPSPERDRDWLWQRFGLVDGTVHVLQSIATAHGVSRERVRQVEAAALRNASYLLLGRRAPCLAALMKLTTMGAGQARTNETQLRAIVGNMPPTAALRFAKAVMGHEGGAGANPNAGPC
jgi:hypothetical protein